jgi:hypothetical protein
MGAFLYRCPATSQMVQAFVADAPDEQETYVQVRCMACRYSHLVNPKSGRVAGNPDEN